MPTSMHTGGCHCGNVRYSVEVDPTAQAIACNCSICGRTGSYLQFVPTDKFTLEKGEDAQTDYLFNKHVIHHLFCSTCGVRSFARGQKPDGTPMIAINVRCLDGVNAHEIPTMKYDGASK